MWYTLIETCKEGLTSKFINLSIFLSSVSIDNVVKMTKPSTTVPQMSVMREEYTDFQDVGKLFIVLLF